MAIDDCEDWDDFYQCFFISVVFLNTSCSFVLPAFYCYYVFVLFSFLPFLPAFVFVILSARRGRD